MKVYCHDVGFDVDLKYKTNYVFSNLRCSMPIRDYVQCILVTKMKVYNLELLDIICPVYIYKLIFFNMH